MDIGERVYDIDGRVHFRVYRISGTFVTFAGLLADPMGPPYYAGMGGLCGIAPPVELNLFGVWSI